MNRIKQIHIMQYKDNALVLFRRDHENPDTVGHHRMSHQYILEPRHIRMLYAAMSNANYRISHTYTGNIYQEEGKT